MKSQILKRRSTIKIIIAGSRGLLIPTLIIDNYIKEITSKVSEIISGNCNNSPDVCGERWAKLNGIPIKLFIPDWETYKKAAGPIRNKAMAEYGDILLAFWDGKSRGTQNIIDNMKKLRKPVNIITCERSGDKLIYTTSRI